MALYKEIKEENGVVTRYHRVHEVEVRTAVKQTVVTVASYVDEEARSLGIPYAATECVVVLPLCKEIEAQPIFSHVYGLLKNEERFEGATDV